ncbi:hypothetical protein HPB48_014027 [Haemaphysalis longicornis]|uniref:Peptidase M13 C-terminal domain-containing protein n=1 Tax=Haemaphysalis longicornis TaxID=44386 RepID=A0A9J6G583_HAELO|nr:hypothetical protein HPB48_014027 [Haemaphysalis longicornis]
MDGKPLGCSKSGVTTELLKTPQHFAWIWLSGGQLPLWFHVDLLLPNPDKNVSNPAILISPSPLPAVWERLHKVIVGYGEQTYLEFVKIFKQIIYRNRILPKTYLSFLERSEPVQRYVFANMSSAYLAPYATPAVAKIRHLAEFVNQLSTEDWVLALQSCHHFSPPLTGNETFFVSNADIIKSMQLLFNSYSADEITFHTAWWLTQLLGAHSSREIRDYIKSDRLGHLLFQVSCGTLFSTDFNVLLASVNLPKLTIKEKELATALLKIVHDAAINKLQVSRALDNQSMAVLSEKLKNTSTVIWPEKRYMTPNSFEQLYGPLCNASLGCFRCWHASRLSLSKLIGSEQYVAGIQVFKINSRSLSSYNPILNVLSVAETALNPPYFYLQVPTAVHFGGLGFLYATEVARALDALTVYLAHLKSIPANPAAAGDRGMYFWKLFSCPEALNPRTLFPELPALEIAHSMYLEFHAPKYDMPLKDMETYTPEQVFFITACHSLCAVGSHGKQWSEKCNHIMRNFEPFAAAFKCPPNSRMNPGAKCRFF